jgi:ribosomal protein S18 acetylase RimI-like enzyme
MIRPWNPSDIPGVRLVAWTTWLDAYSRFIPVEDLKSYFDEHYSAEALADLQRTPFVEGFVAVDGEIIVGFIRTQLNKEENRFYVSSIYVLPGYQGHKLGMKLFQAGEDIGRKYGMADVWLGVMEQNVSALNWYKKMGFVFVQELPFAMGKTSVNHFIGYKKIQ